jgi:hypothetical protein
MAGQFKHLPKKGALQKVLPFLCFNDTEENLRVCNAGLPMTDRRNKERRKFDRKITLVNLDLLLSGRTVPLRASTTDLSVGGCYIQNIYPLPIGTRVEISIAVGDEKVFVQGIVKTCHPSFGNGIQFCEMAPADRVKLESFLQGEYFLESE